MRTMSKIITLLKMSHGIDDLDDETKEEINDAKNLIVEGCNRKSPFSLAVVQCVLPYRNAPYLADIVGQLDLEP